MCDTQQFTKTVRLPLSLAEPFLKEFQDLKIVYLVRDPRATLHSRKGRDFCVDNPVCMDPERLCGELTNDFNSYINLKKIYPERVK